MDKSVPAVENGDVCDAVHAITVIFVILKVVLAVRFRAQGVRSILESLGKILHASYVLNLLYLDLFWRVNIHENFLIQIVISDSLVPERINHDDILAWVEDVVVVQ